MTSLDGFEDIYGFMLLHAVLLATLSAISGILLSAEGGYETDLINRHMWLGVATAVFSYASWLVFNRLKIKSPVFSLLMVLCGISLIAGSHNGGTLTHGENYLSPESKKESAIAKRPVTDSSPVYSAAIQPILEARCYGCHNAKKAKGELVMSKTDLFLKGGKDGAPWIPGDPQNSLLVKRISLEAADKKHMPPKGKPQLSEKEILLIHQWIGKGASFEKAFRAYPESDSFRILASSFTSFTSNLPAEIIPYSFDAADPNLVAKLNNPYRRITAKNNRSPALDLNFYISRQYKPAMLEECKPLRKQIVYINLSNMPVEDPALKEISQYENLEELLLNGTNISGKTLDLLSSCRKLKNISLANTKVSLTYIELLGRLPGLKKIYLWQTGVSNSEIATLEKKYPLIEWDHGYLPDSTEHLKLTSPMMRNPEKMIFGSAERLELRHPMPGVTIRYTINDKEPDSINSPVYTEPLSINVPTVLKAIAVSPGWYASDIKEFVLFSKGIKPSNAVLLSKADTKYALQGGPSLIDGNKGESNNLLVNWLGFRTNTLLVQFRFDQPDSIKTVVLSMADNNGSYVMPPVSIIIHGGSDSSNLKPIGKLIPVQPTKYGPVRNKAYTIPIKAGIYRYIRVEATPVPSLPKWHSGKKDKGWIFVDEIFFY